MIKQETKNHTVFKIYKRLIGNFFRKELELNNYWIHRLSKIVLIVIICITTFIGYNDFRITGYDKSSKLVEILSDEPTSVKEIINKKYPNEKVFISDEKFEPNINKDDAWIVQRDSLCAKNMHLNIEKLNLEGYEFYAGEMFKRIKLDKKNFLVYLKNKNLNCIVPTFYTNTLGQEIPMIQTYSKDVENNTHIYTESKIKTYIYFVFGTYFSNASYIYSGIWVYTLLPLLIMVTLYFKVVIYIVFGKRNT